MKTYNSTSQNQALNRRHFFGFLGKGVSVFGLASLGSTQVKASSQASTNASELDAWFDKIKGNHKIVFDAPSTHNGFQVIWTWVFLDSHNQTGTSDEDMTAVVVLRHTAIGLAMDSKLWKKYKLGKHFSVTDPVSNTPADRNPYWDPQEGEMPELGMSIKKLQERGVMFCVCERAITNNSNLIAHSKNLNPIDVKKELMSGLLPGIQAVPSGVWAVEKAQKQGCAYCFAG